MASKIINNRNFVFLWLGHLISHSGDAIYTIAIAWLLLDMTGSSSSTGWVLMSAYLPALIFGLFAGVLVDRYNRKGIMIISDVMRAILVAIVPMALIFDFVSPLLIGIATFFLATFATLFYPARDSLIPHITDSEDLPTANSAISVSGQMSHLLGPLFAGIGLSIFGITHLFTADALSFLFSILMISLIAIPVNDRSNQELETKKIVSLVENLKEGFQYMITAKGIMTLLFLTFINNMLIMGPAFLGLPVFVKDILEEDLKIYAYLEASMATGMIFGSVIFWFLIKSVKPAHILLIGIVVDGMTFSLLYFVKSNFSAIVVLCIHGMGIPLITIARTTLIQIVVPDKFRGRLFSMIYTSVMGTTAISIGLTGILLEYVGVDMFF